MTSLNVILLAALIFLAGLLAFVFLGRNETVKTLDPETGIVCYTYGAAIDCEPIPDLILNWLVQQNQK